MALFQKRPAISSELPAYSIGANRTLLIIGLGNPGKQYKLTRHNIGFDVLDNFAGQNSFPAWTAKKDLQCDLCVSQLGSTRVILAKPTTYMNDSGRSASQLIRFYKLTSQDVVAVYDELAIPFGQIRARVGGSDAGHNGVKSLISHIGDGFGRLRIGIGPQKPDGIDSASFVLAKFSGQEQSDLPVIINEASVMLGEFVYSGQLPPDTRNVL
jgi:PTH1 family peptidyl-tRNA hydrolase